VSAFVTQCMNCDATLDEDNPSLFCNERCRSEAEFVRYWRRVTRDGRIEREDVQYAIQIQLAHWVAGGYDRVERRIPLGVREQVRARDNNRCVKCGAVGVEIDHIDGPDVALTNLQLLCVAYHHEKTAESLVPAEPPRDRCRLSTAEG